MKIETKYNIGDRVWLVYESSFYNGLTEQMELSGEVGLYDSKIDSITIDDDELVYNCEDGNYTELRENEVILYEEKDKLFEKIKEVMQSIHEREEKE